MLRIKNIHDTIRKEQTYGTKPKRRYYIQSILYEKRK